MGFIRRERGGIWFDDLGTGSPVVILRGLGRSASYWLGWDKVLAETLRVIPMDLRGLGRTTCPWTFQTSFDDIADDISSVLDQLGLAKAHVFGVSLGGMVTLAMGLRHPARCLSLVTVNTSVGRRVHERISPQALAALVTARGPLKKGFQRRMTDVLVGPGMDPAGRAEVTRQHHALESSEGLYGETVARQLWTAARFNPAPDLIRIAGLPTMIVYGTADRFVPPVNSRRIAAMIPGARLAPVEGGGHELMLDKPRELARLVTEWVREVEAAGT